MCGHTHTYIFTLHIDLFCDYKKELLNNNKSISAFTCSLLIRDYENLFYVTAYGFAFKKILLYKQKHLHFLINVFKDRYNYAYYLKKLRHIKCF